MSSKHDPTALYLARKFGADYNRGKGADIKTPDMAIEVETAASIKKDGLNQLQGFQKPCYIAAADSDAVEPAMEATDGTTVGVMDPNGNILKKSTRGKARRS